MLTRFKKYLRPPTLDDPVKDNQAKNLYWILVSVLALTSIYFLYSLFFPPPGQIIVAVSAIFLEVGLLVAVVNGNLQTTSIVFTSLLWTAVLGEVVLFGGVRDTGFAMLAVVIIIAGLTLGMRAAYIYTIISILAGLVLWAAENQGLLPPYSKVSAAEVLASHGLLLISVAVLLYPLSRNLIELTTRHLEIVRQFREMQLTYSQNRNELETYTSILQQRNIALQAITEVSRLASQSQNIAALLDQITTLVADRMGLHHVGIFLIEQSRERAILKSANSEEGKKLVADNYQIVVSRGEFSYLYSGTAVLRFRVGTHTYLVSEPLPIKESQANHSFPLITGERLIGIMNIQTQTARSLAEEKEVYQTIADQIALALDNINLSGQFQGQLDEINRLAGTLVREAWEKVQLGGMLGYQYDRLQVLPAGEQFPSTITKQILAGKVANYVTGGENPRARLIAPIVLRKQVIGVLGYEDIDSSHEWLPEDKNMLETIASQVSLALENTRLVTEAQQRATREQNIAQISTRIGSEINLDTILLSTVEELSRVIPDSDIIVQIQPATKNE